MKLDLDNMEAASESSRRTFHAPLISPDELAALVRIAREAQAACRIEHPGMVYQPLLKAVREAGL